MRAFEDIRKEAEEECLNSNCQSWPVICIVAMEKAVKEYAEEISDFVWDWDLRQNKPSPVDEENL